MSQYVILEHPDSKTTTYDLTCHGMPVTYIVTDWGPKKIHTKNKDLISDLVAKGYQKKGKK